ncbi:hypothetical protein GQ457_10G005800 [Hibiscus cannabinus]
MKEGESVFEYFGITLTIANKMKAHGESMCHVKIVEKILRSMTSKFVYVVCSIEESNDVDILTIDELQSSLLVHEQCMKGHETNEQALKVALDYRSSTRRCRGFRRGNVQVRGRGRGQQTFGKDTIECWKCHQLGHFQYECPRWEEKINYTEIDDEEILPMTQLEPNEAKEETWFLDTGCSNHMCENKQWFFNFDEDFRQSVKLGNNSKIEVLGKGTIRLQIGGKTQVISNVYYILELRNNLLSISQLQ